MRAIEIPHSATYQDLRADGLTREAIRTSIGAGTLFHARRDVYMPRTYSDRVLQAARVGGRLDCTSLMRECGVFVLASEQTLHVQIPKHRARLRSPSSRTMRLSGKSHRVTIHWRDDPADARALFADPVQALAQAVRCQSPRAAVATLDSALNTGLIWMSQLDAVFAHLPVSQQVIRPLIDERAESGPETLARLICRTFGVSVEPQVWINGVGRVDLVIDGWIIVECDSRGFHSGWERQESDRMRDLAAAARGYASLRPTANQLFSAPDVFRSALAGLLGRGPR